VTWGFQSLSKMMTVSAVARLMPRPPARVLSRKAKSVDSGALKCSIACTTAHRMAPQLVGKREQFFGRNLGGHCGGVNHSQASLVSAVGL